MIIADTPDLSSVLIKKGKFSSDSFTKTYLLIIDEFLDNLRKWK